MIVYQILKALHHLHKQEIVHRDLKPENVLISPRGTGARAILTDFGHAIKAVEAQGKRPRRMQTLCGTLDWVAPYAIFHPINRSSFNCCGSEIRGKNRLVRQPGYTKAVDMWSLGCLTTALITGTSIFVNTQDSEFRQDSTTAVTKAAAKCDLTVLDDSPTWQRVSSRAVGFVKQLLKLDESTRLSAERALKHEWFTDTKGKTTLEEAYSEMIKGWTRTTPGWDFIEDLGPYLDQKHCRSRFDFVPGKKSKPPSARQLSSRLPKNHSPAILKTPQKRRRSSSLDSAEAAIYAQAGKENKGFVTARMYGKAVAKKRFLLLQQQQR